MIWRRWIKIGRLNIFGRPVTPFGPRWLVRRVAAIFHLHGDIVDDFRLLDYFVALMSTETSPGLDGQLGNDRRLRQDLADFGIFDTDMPMYLLNRLRNFSDYGFSGFESRYYSLFMDIEHDMGQATTLQNLITALAFKLIFSGQITHAHIPDTPFTESERRQIFFGSAIGIPTFFVRRDTQNQFMARILQHVANKRNSRRYRGYIRVHNIEYRQALLHILKTDAADLIDMLPANDTITDLQARLADPHSAGAAGRLVNNILSTAGAAHPLEMPAREFNQSAEHYYRHILRQQQMRAAATALAEDLKRLDDMAMLKRHGYDQALSAILHGQSAGDFFDSIRRDLIHERIGSQALCKLIHLTLLTIDADMRRHGIGSVKS